MYMAVELYGGGVSIGPLAASGEALYIVRARPTRLEVFQGNTFGGILGYSSCFTDMYEVPSEIANALPTDLTSWSVRVKFQDAVAYSSHSDVEVTFYQPNGTALTAFNRRVHCNGILFGSVDVDATLRVSRSPIGNHRRRQYTQLGW